MKLLRNIVVPETNSFHACRLPWFAVWVFWINRLAEVGQLNWCQIYPCKAKHLLCFCLLPHLMRANSPSQHPPDVKQPSENSWQFLNHSPCFSHQHHRSVGLPRWNSPPHLVPYWPIYQDLRSCSCPLMCVFVLNQYWPVFALFQL